MLMPYRKNPVESYWKILEARANKAIRENNIIAICKSPARDSKGRFVKKAKPL